MIITLPVNEDIRVLSVKPYQNGRFHRRSLDFVQQVCDPPSCREESGNTSVFNLCAWLKQIKTRLPTDTNRPFLNMITTVRPVPLDVYAMGNITVYNQRRRF